MSPADILHDMRSEGRFDLNLLIVLDALIELGSTKAAARRLGVTQSAVSYSLARLRGHFGEELFRRTRSGMAPTEFTMSIAEPLRRALNTIRGEILTAGTFDPRSAERSFRIASSEIGELLLLPPLLKALRREAPGIVLDWQPIPAHALEAVMAEGRIDLMISGFIEGVDSSQFFQQRLYSHEFVGLVRSDHPVLQETHFPEALRKIPAYLISSSSSTRRRLVPLVEAAGIELARDLATTRLLSFPFLLQQSDAYAVLPKAVATLAARFAPLTVFPLPLELPRIEVRQFWHRRFHADPAHVWLRQLVAGIFMNNDPTPAA